MILSLIIFNCNSKKGCTDSKALNYDTKAKKDDGSCVQKDFLLQPQVITNLDAILKESSGLLNTDNLIWSFGDSGNKSEIYSIDTNNGSIAAAVALTGVSNIDFEDIAQDSSYIYVGDFGNNNGNRTDLVIYKIPKKTSWNTTNNITPEAIHFSYPDQKDFKSNSASDFDCEAMITQKGNIYIFTKDHSDQHTRLYKLPTKPGNYTAELMSTFDSHGLITGADITSDGSKIALTGYNPSTDVAFVWVLNNFTNNQFFSGNNKMVSIGPRAIVGQVEGVCFLNNNLLYISNEQKYTIPARLWKLDISRVK